MKIARENRRASLERVEMDTTFVLPAAIVAGFAALVIFGVLILVTRFYRQVDQGRALIVNKMRAEPVVADFRAWAFCSCLRSIGRASFA